MSTFKLAASSMAGVGIGAGIANFMWGSSKDSTQTIPPPTAPGNNLPAGAPNGSIQLVGSNINPAGFFQYGFPGPIHDLQTRQEFVSCYDRERRNPSWVVEHITPESLNVKGGDRKNSVFREDEQIPQIFRGKLKDYFRSGYDRGHQAPAANAKFSQEAMNETFFLTNMSPQVGEGFNRDYWAHLEYFCRQLTDKYNSVRIVTGPLYLPKLDPRDGKYRVSYEMIGNPPNIAVPTHFFKLVVAEQPKKNPSTDELSVAAFVLPNDRIPNETKLTDFVVPVEALERSSGMQFLQKVPANKKKDLCKQVQCQITVREFNNSMKQLPAPAQPLALPAPRK